MQSSQHRIVSALPTVFFLIVWISTAWGQVQPEQLYQAYKEKDFTRLQSLLEQLKTSQKKTPEIRFYQALFKENADSAVEVYNTVFNRGDDRIKLLAAEKLYEYYYAKGFYVTAEKYQKYMAEHRQDDGFVKTETDAQNPLSMEKVFYIQVGAFGIKENAQQRRMFLKTQDVQSILVERNVDGRILYCVWVKGKADIEKTLELANRLKSKFDLEYQIMKK